VVIARSLQRVQVHTHTSHTQTHTLTLFTLGASHKNRATSLAVRLHSFCLIANDTPSLGLLLNLTTANYARCTTINMFEIRRF
jgi:hypothetical protein